MRKFLPQISLITIFTLAIGFFAVPQTASAGIGDLVLDSLFGTIDVLYGVLGKVFWWGLIPLAGFVFRMLGAVMDIALSMSLDGTFYNAPAIGLAWSVIRDIANMLFIFVLIYEGIRTVLNLGNLVTVRKTITSVILAAIFLNFSLFFTKVIIDVSNITATWFIQGVVNVGGGASVSDSVRSVLKMEKLTAEYSGFTDKKSFTLDSFTIGVILFVLMCVAIYVFFNIIFLIIGRIVSFIFLLITAPIGFVGALVPMLQDYSKKWWSELNNQAMMLPMFFLMVYLTLFIVDQMNSLLTAGSIASDTFDAANYVIFIIIIMMLLKALKVAEEYSGELGKMFGGLAKSATTFVGGSAIIGTVGRAAGALKSSEWLQEAASKNSIGGMAARGVMMGANTTANASFGAKSGYGNMLKATGLDKTGLKDQFKGADKGYEGKKKEEMKVDKEFAENFKGPNAGRRREEYARYLQGVDEKGNFKPFVSIPGTGFGVGKGRGILGATMNAVGMSAAADTLRKSGGRVAAGDDLMKKDKEIASYKKAQIEEKQKPIKDEVKALKKELADMDADLTKLDEQSKLLTAAGMIDEEFKDVIDKAEKIKDRKKEIASSIEKKEADIAKLGEEISKQEKTIKSAEDSETLQRLKDEIKKDDKENGPKSEEKKESPKEEPKKE